MSDSEWLEKELMKRALRKKEKLFKDSELEEVLEEVFDFWTIRALYKLMNKGVIGRIFGVVAAGKEARIYWGESPSGDQLAIKIFLVTTAEFRKGRMKYIEGDPRFRVLRKGMRNIVRLWCHKEFRNLKRAYDHGISVPKPYAHLENILVMEFIDAGEPGVPAPLIKEKPPENPGKAFREIKFYIRKLYKDANLVHADLSEYNILNRRGQLVIIDWGSAVLTSHVHAKEFLLKDISNIYRFFSRLGVDTGDPVEFYRELVGEKI